MAKVGDKVFVTTKDGIEEGVLMPSPDKDIVLIKLNTGYNIGFKKEEVKSIEVKEILNKIEEKPKKLKKNKNLPTIAILHTGGTIASKIDYKTGAVSADFDPAELVKMFPELAEIANIESELISQMFSDDLRFKNFSTIAKKIEEYVKKGVEGIIVGMGTDNMAVASAALSFIIEKSPIPIIFVGSQRSSDRGSSDAGVNLISAAKFIVESNYGGVAICMHATASDDKCVILSPNKTYKMHSSRRDAFTLVNSDSIAIVNLRNNKIEFKTKEYQKKSKELIVKPKMEEKVGYLRIHVNMVPEQFSFYKGYKGLILEGTGLGHTPGDNPNKDCQIHKKIYSILKELNDSGCVIVMTTQCLFGRVNMNVYSRGRDLQNVGVIAGEDMLANTAFVKLSWLLANYPKDKIKELITQNLRGEISLAIPFKEEFKP